MKSAIAFFSILLLPAFLMVGETLPVSPAKNVTIDEAEKTLKENKQVVVIDLRTPAEFKGGHLEGAKNLDFLSPEFAKKVSELDKSKTYLVHCAAGGRSTKSLKVFQDQKFGSVLHLSEGFQAWQKAGKPVAKE
ncbi:MAG: rhodanese-like domain-containing protein [Verrucomicrobiota bacterium]|nr:rhodanese-like domain-containing protein [Verrucomicrobiota bacterium]